MRWNCLSGFISICFWNFHYSTIFLTVLVTDLAGGGGGLAQSLYSMRSLSHWASTTDALSPGLHNWASDLSTSSGRDECFTNSAANDGSLMCNDSTAHALYGIRFENNKHVIISKIRNLAPGIFYNGQLNLPHYPSHLGPRNLNGWIRSPLNSCSCYEAAI